MKTTELIERLASDLKPTPQRARRLGLAILIGGVVALAGLWALFGLRPDLASAMLTTEFWVKWSFTLAVALAAFILCSRLARPEGKAGWWPLGLVLPILALGVAACVEMMATAQPERQMIWMGQTAVQCMWCIPLLALPLLIGILWAFRFFAPTRLRLAGFCAGLLSGAAAATLYALHCEETAMAFVATWYSVGMLLPALLGWLFGPRVLRW